MHELGIVFYVIDAVKKACEENKASKVNKVTLEIGEVSSVIPSYFKDCYSWAIKKEELLKDSILDLIIVEAISFCDDCKKTYQTTKYGKTCPHCKSDNTYLVTGRDVIIKNIEVE